ncbi:MAG: YceI family protein [Acidimicrobiales bacterium]
MKRLAIGAAGVALALIAAVLIYFNLIRSDAPDEFVLTEQTETQTSESAADDAGSTDETGSDSSASDTTEAATVAPEPSLDGIWTVSHGSEAGYRVVEDLRGIQDFEAVGRTDQITGSIEIAGTAINAASFEVDVASIASDESHRDGHFTGPVMNAEEFPTATLTLLEPIALGATPADGAAVAAEAVAELTLRGVTNQVSFPVDAQLLGDRIELVASIDVLFSDYGIDNPTNPVVTVRDEGKVEVRLLLSRG